MDIVHNMSTIQALQDTVLWRYYQYARPLPWRFTDDPYAIWISETMLCQTQVSRVIRYYDRRLQLLPDMQALAQADRKMLLQAWAWLWYNSRALRLQMCAQTIIHQYQGIIPQSYDQLIALPWIWDYIASALWAFVYHQDIPVIDTNIRRVLLHRFDLPRDTHKKKLKEIAKQTIPLGQARLWRNAMMDYGALVLTPQVTGIQSQYRQSAFEWSTRQVRSRIIKQLLIQSHITILDIKHRRSKHDVISIVNKLQTEKIVDCKQGLITLQCNIEI